MKRLFSCCLFLAGILINYNSYSQCTPDANCTPAQLICPATLPSGCEGDSYSTTVTISLGSTIAGATFVDITLNGLTGIPGLNFACSPNCVFLPNSLNCILISVPASATGTYPIRANLLVDLGFFQLPVDTAIGSITIAPKDCAGVCDGTASIDNCGICSGGTTGILPNCDDGDLCTTDACDGSGGCINTTITCDDGDDCTTDVCDNGICSFNPITCDDVDDCTNDFCQGGLCQNIAVNCDDGDSCTIDICDLGICNNTPDPLCINPCDTITCDDGDICTTDACDNGLCSFEPVTCDDLDLCTDDACDSLTGCAYTAVNCDDGDSCTIDICDLGICSNTPDPLCINPCDTITCDDADDCTTDACDNGLCSFTPTNCDDGDSCTIDGCDLGICTNTPDPLCINPCDTITCDDGDECTTDACDNGLCSFTPLSCDDSNACTNDFCQGGLCQNISVNCDDGDACTEDACDSLTGGCNNTSISCDDLSVCTGVETCDSLTGCVSGTPLVCDDGDSCTIDGCEALAGCFSNPDPICSGNPCDSLSPELAFDYTVVCAGETGTVTNLSTGVDAGATYYLDLGSDGSIDLSIPAADLPADSSFIVGAGTADFTLIVVNSTGCSDTLTLSVTTPEKPELAFDYTPVCEGENTTVVNLSTGVDAGAIYYFDVNNDGSVEFTVPASALPADSTITVSAGTLNLSVVVVNSTGCSDTLIISLSTPAKPELAFDYTPVCEGENTTVTNLSTGVDAGAIYYFDVDNDGSIEFTVPASALPADSTITVSAGTLNLSVVVVNSTGCSDTLIISLSTPAKPELAFDYTPVCEGENTTVTNLSTGVDAGAIYYFDVDNDGSIEFTVPASALPADSTITVSAGTLTLNVIVVNSTGCSDTLLISLSTPAKPVLAFDYQNGCAGDTTYITNLSTGVDAGAIYYLDLGSDGFVDYTIPASALPADSAAVLPISGNIDFTVIVVNSTGCSDTLNASIVLLDCNDNDACTDDACDAATGCTYSAVDCNDNNACTDDACDAATGCTYSAVDCNDNDACTDDACDAATGCTYSAVDCNDNDACTDDACDAATGCTYSAVDCNDSDACTDDACDAATGCTYSAVDCNDNDACTDDACDAISGCQNTLNKPVLAFDITSACEGENVSITNLSTGVDAGAIYSLDVFNDGTIDLTLPASALPIDSSLVLPAPAGTFDFTVYVVNSTGCSDTLVSTITILEKPVLAFDITSACEGENVSITNLSTGVDAGAIYSLDVFNDGTIDLTLPASALPIDSSLVLPAPAGTFDFTVYVVNSTGCSDTLVSTITVLEKPVLAFDITSACEGENVSITNLSTGVDAGAIYSLDVFNDGTIDLTLPASALPTDSSLVLPAPVGTFDFTVYVVNSTGCSDTLVSTITVLAKPVLAFDYQDVCAGDTAYITNLSTGVDAGATYFLDLGSDGSIDYSLPASALPTDSAAVIPLTGNIDFTVIVVNSTGCSDTLSASILLLDCNDNDACTDDLCENIACSYTPVDCNDNDACTDDACDAATGCTTTPVVCDDADACTTDGCDAATGCTTTSIVCDDADACTTDGCDAATGCTTTPIVCDDADACTTDGCDTATGCTTTPIVCDDADACTTDGCDTATGCTTTPIVCDDADACTSDGCDAATGCTTTPVVCNDNDACTDDACDAATGCGYTPVICDDSDDCTDDACDPLLGCVFTPIVCDDADLCTTDKCEFGVCVFVPINCDDGDLCTSDLCVSGSCEFNPISCDDGDSCTIDACDPLLGCSNVDTCNIDPCAGIDCNDNDACTIDSCNNGVCEQTPVAADVTIEDVTPENCQGSVKLKAVSASATSYSWSSGETTAEIDATPGTTYSVTASAVSSCEATASYTVPAADELLSSYVLLFAKEIGLSKNTVLSGGVGVTNALGKAKFGNGTDISAAATFVKSKIIQVSATSTVTTQIHEKATVTPPAFEFNAQCSAGQSLQVPDNSTVTLSGSLYNGITIGKNCTVTFSGSQIDIENLYSKENTTIRFTAPCVKLRICKKLQLGANNTFNPDASDLVAFVEQDVTIEGGSSVIADIHMLGGKMTVNKGTQSNPNTLTGLFTGNFLEAGDFTTWQQNTTCNPACQPNPPAECDPSERRIYSFTLVNAASDLDIGPLNDGDVIDLALTGPISVRANVCNDGLVESVKFFLDGSFFKVENIAFYTIAGDNNGNYNPWNVTPGTYTITATPYSGDNGSGTPGTSYTVTITIINSALKTDGLTAPASEFSMNAFPNPFSDKLNIEFTLAEDSRATLELFNVSGQKLATLFDGFVKASQTQKTEFIPGSITDGMVIYRLQTQHGTYFNKVLMVK